MIFILTVRMNVKMRTKYLISLFTGGYIGGFSLSITGSILFKRFSNQPESLNLYLGKEIPGQLFGLLISFYLNKIKLNPIMTGCLTASFLPIAIISETYIKSCDDRLVLPLIVLSSISKCIAFTGPIGPHSLANVKLAGNNLAGFSVKSTSVTSIGATIGMMNGLYIKDNESSDKMAIGSSLLFPIILFKGWYKII